MADGTIVYSNGNAGLWRVPAQGGDPVQLLAPDPQLWLGIRGVLALVAIGTTGLLLASFLVTLLGPLFNWPHLLMQLSIFEQYGMPLVEGLHPARVIGLLAFTAALLAIATVRFATKDLVR